HTGMHRQRGFIRDQDRAEWQPRRQRFGNLDNKAPNAELLLGEVAASASQPALNFVQHQKSVMLRGKVARCLDELFAHRTNAALALNCLETHSANGPIELVLQIFDIIELDEADAGQQRSKRHTVLSLTSSGERAKGSSMKRIV